MSVILVFILILWAWYGDWRFSLRIGHASWPKIDFLLLVYYDVGRYSLLCEKVKTDLQRGLRSAGLHNV